MARNWFEIDNVHKADTPFVAVFPDRVKENINALKEIIPEVNRIRPHVKTSKSKHTVAVMMEAGITKFKCATIAEAEMLAIARTPDVLLAYQPVGPKIGRLLSLVKKYPDTIFSCLTDDIDIAKEISAAASEKSMAVHIWLDINIGMNRTGIDPKNAFDLYHRVGEMPGMKLKGIHAYDGHINTSDFGIRKMEWLEGFKKIESLKGEIIKNGFPMPAINAGSTPTLKLYADKKDVEISPGTFIYWDQTYNELYRELPFKIAMLVVARVISKPGDETICLDLGYKSVSSESISKQRVYFLNLPDAEIIGESEEHLLVKTARSGAIKIGDMIYGIPFHIGRTFNLYTYALSICNQQIYEEWPRVTGR